MERILNHKVYFHLSKAYLILEKSHKILSLFKSANHKNKKQARQERAKEMKMNVITVRLGKQLKTFYHQHNKIKMKPLN